MEILITIMLVLLLLIVITFTVYFFLNKKNEKIKELESSSSSTIMLSDFERKITNQINSTFESVQKNLDYKMSLIDSKVNNNLEKSLNQTKTSYEDMIARLAKIDEAQNNISKLEGSVTSLTNVLENNQNRGKFGEFTLERILFSIFGDAKKGVYQLQYPLKENDLNERPDAVIFLPEPQKILCIDSKFPYQDYKRLLETKDEAYKVEFAKAVKMHINCIASKYIINGITAPNALMFIPSDAIFGFINGELYDVVEYANKKHVVITSPSTLQPILSNINMIKIEMEKNKNVSFILEQLKRLSVDFQKFVTDWDRFSKNLNQTLSVKEDFDNRIIQMKKKFERIERIEVEE